MASPQLSAMLRIINSAIDYGVNGDEAAARQLALSATPSGLKGLTESVVGTDEEGFVLDKKGQRKYDQPRTQWEQDIRSATAIRPLRERVEDEQLWARRKAESSRQEQLKLAASRLAMAWIDDNLDDARKHIAAYVEAGGDPRNILSEDQIAKLMADAQKSGRQRAAGVPTNNLNSINRYKNYAN